MKLTVTEAVPIHKSNTLHMVNYCKKLGSLQHLLRTTSANLQI